MTTYTYGISGTAAEAVDEPVGRSTRMTVTDAERVETPDHGPVWRIRLRGSAGEELTFATRAPEAYPAGKTVTVTIGDAR